MKDNKKKWTQPQLIVLGRGTPEENVLGGCKRTTKVLAGPATTKTICKKKSGTQCKTQCNVLSTTS